MLGQELLVRAVRVMDKHNIEYMLTGSYASSLQGHPRSTNDIDIAVEVSTSQVHELMAARPAGSDLDTVNCFLYLFYDYSS